MDAIGSKSNIFLMIVDNNIYKKFIQN